MTTPKLARHGEHIKRAYAPKAGRAKNWAGESTNSTRPDGNISGIVKRYRKSDQACERGISFGLIKAKYQDAIEYTGIPRGTRGLVMFLGLSSAWLALWWGHMTLDDIIRDEGVTWFSVFSGSISAVFIVVGISIGLKSIRLELFRPEDEPIIFDRGRKKVYRIFRDGHPGLRGLLKNWPLRAVEYDWDLIDVEHNARLVTTGSTLMRYHTLIFIVRRSASDPTIIDSFNVGSSLQLGEQTVPAVWEHIRKFMEEDGPHVPPGEVITPALKPQTFIESIVAVGPFGENYRQWWKDYDSFMILIHVLFPFFLLFFFFLGIFNWLSNLTATRISWPQEVLDAVHEPYERKI